VTRHNEEVQLNFKWPVLPQWPATAWELGRGDGDFCCIRTD
jgi:hypothetical protein